MSEIDAIKEQIKTAMESQGTYSEDLDLCIYLCAGSYQAFRIALKDISKRKKAYVEELTREGNKKLVAHPSFKILFDSLEVTRKALRELGLTLQTLSATEDDEVGKLIEDVENAAHDGE